MKLQFDPKQEYQIAAVNAVVDLFDGQPLSRGDFEISFHSEGFGVFSGQKQTELGVGNQLLIDRETLLKNLQRVQEQNDLDVDNALLPALYDDKNAPAPLNFSVEMETGTGKTYVYLRTIFELSRKYGFKKFIIVVPSVAIREGVMKNLEITQEHFKALYNNLEYEYFVYDAKKINRLWQFAMSNTVQILVINIDAFRKNFTGTEEEQKSNVIYKENDRLSGRQPIEFVRATNPIVIIDEPQSVDNTEKAQEAIRALNPLCTLRYSATHRNPYNLVYKLDPIRAYSLRLVKQIVVSSITGEGAFNDAYVRVKEIGYGKNARTPNAKLVIHAQGKDGVKEREVKVKGGEDLFLLSNERECYRNGFVVDYVDATPGDEHIGFTNGNTLNLGQEIGGIRDDLWRSQIRNTVRKHLDKELQMRGRGIKVLSLFFIDKVVNYRSYDDSGQPVPGKFAVAFEETFRELITQERYKSLAEVYGNIPIGKLHDGYFAQDKKGVFKDTSGNTQADDDVYNLIMKDKERLLALDEPLRFIFSHSALREGWDNPNVFQICTLNETRSVTKKRQEIGRGLRLPVNQDGQRIFDENINKLHVVANESYEEFARSLQTEYEEDCGVTFGKVPKMAFAKLTTLAGEEEKTLGCEQSEKLWTALVASGFLTEDGKITPKFDPKDPDFDLCLPAEFNEFRANVIEVLESYRLERHIRKDEDQRPLRLNKQVYLDPEFKQLWDRIKAKTIYSVEYDTGTLVTNAVKSIKEMEPIKPVRIHVSEAALDIENAGVQALILRESGEYVVSHLTAPDILAYLQDKTELTRSTLVRILKDSGRLGEFLINPQKFMDSVAAIIARELHRLMIDGIKYEKIAGDEYEMRLFETEEIMSYLQNRYELQNKDKSVFDAITFDSEIERRFAEDLDRREEIKLFVKLPPWFNIKTPIGDYNPDWAILKHDETTLYLVRETKGTKDFEKLRISEAQKIRCGRKHFEALGTGVSFAVVTSAAEV